MKKSIAFAGASIIATLTSAVHAQLSPTHDQGRFADFVSLRVMHDKGLITDDEYRSAKAEAGASVGDDRANDDVTSLVVGKWSATLYGFVEGDFIFDST